ncbi:MAG: hypothetical protein EOP34_08675 [Rickettsiales bacterium]|nr:MAG: hypothetical protein EOP34_08675 [Rickettsiales bacterium]
MKIKSSKIRGIKSDGMLCSFTELNIKSNDLGIIELPDDTVIGEKFYKIYGLNDPIIKLSITPNRGDCLGVYGIARELAASGIGSLKNIAIDNLEMKDDLPVEIHIRTKLCNAYHLIYFSDINNKITHKYTDRLKAIGVNSHSPIVDFGNYIAYSYNRPIHIFDADKIYFNFTFFSTFHNIDNLLLNFCIIYTACFCFNRPTYIGAANNLFAIT